MKRTFLILTAILGFASLSAYAQDRTRGRSAASSRSDIRVIKLPGVPEGNGHFVPALVHNGLVYVSGQTPRDLVTGKYETGSMEAQTELALRNVEKILRASGSDLSRVLQMTIYISDLGLWEPVNSTVRKVMGDHKPARTVIPVKDLYSGTKIEIQVIAAVR